SLATADRWRRAAPRRRRAAKPPPRVSSRLVSARRRPSRAREFRRRQAQPRVDHHRVEPLQLGALLQAVWPDLFQDNERSLAQSTDQVQAHTQPDWWELSRCVAIAATPAYSKPQKLSCR